MRRFGFITSRPRHDVAAYRGENSRREGGDAPSLLEWAGVGADRRPARYFDCSASFAQLSFSAFAKPARASGFRLRFYLISRPDSHLNDFGLHFKNSFSRRLCCRLQRDMFS